MNINNENSNNNFIFWDEELEMTKNGCPTNTSSGSSCLDLFFCAGSARKMSSDDIYKLVVRSYAEDPDMTMKIIFFARDIRGGLGERKFFRTAINVLVKTAPDSVRRNMQYIAEYGRYDDILPLLDTELAKEVAALIKKQLKADIEAMNSSEKVSLLAKWLPSVNTSSSATVARAKKLASLLGMKECQYRKTLASLRKYTDILENRLRERDYTFSYEIQPSRAMLKYRKAFMRNDKERYDQYIQKVNSGEAKIHADCLFPYDIVRTCINSRPCDEEKRALDAEWRSLPELKAAAGENALVVVDGSGSMYGCYARDALRPIDAAISLGIYFAEHNKGAFANHFITFSERPRLVELKGSNIVDKVKYCMTFNECANTNLEAVFNQILCTAVRKQLTNDDMPKKIYIISDMEFDYCVGGGNNATLYDTMKKRYHDNGYELPEVVFWNVNSRAENVPVKMNANGTALVSGYTPAIFDMVASGGVSPSEIMLKAISSERYAPVSA